MIFDKAGNLYGATEEGGVGRSVGVVFKLSPKARGDWKETILHSFKGGTDGRVPYGTPIFDKKGNLYGTTSEGGGSGCAGYGFGTVFKLMPGKGDSWKETILHRFTGADGSYPGVGSLVIDADGNIFGTTALGGQGNCLMNNPGCGIVFEITP